MRRKLFTLAAGASAMLCAGVFVVATIAAREESKPSNCYSAELSRNAAAEVRVGPEVVFHIAGDTDRATVTLEVARRPVPMDVDLTRQATVVVSKTEARIVIIHERFASNEDRIQVVDARKNRARTYKMEHADAGDYVHVHYAVSEKITDGCFEVTETQYAGSRPPRERTILIPLGTPAEFRVASWRAIDDRQTATRPSGG